MSKLLSVSVSISPHVAIFGFLEEYTQYSSTQLEVMAFTSIIARRHLLLHWKSTTAPSNTQWLDEVMSFLKVEKIKYSRSGCLSKFGGRWQPLLELFQNI